jgi:uncharacterized membrane protein YfcA
MDYLVVFGVFAVGFLASWVGSMVGGGGLLSIPFLIFLGLPPQVAVATNKFSAIGLKFTAFYKYWKEEKILWQYVAPLAFISFFGALAGSLALVSISSELLLKLVGFFIIALLPTLFINPERGEKNIQVGERSRLTGYVAYAFVTVYAAFFGGGAGVLFNYVMIYFFGTTIVESSATLKVPGIVITSTAIAVFALNGLIDYYYGIFMLIGMALGGYAGAHTAVSKGDRWVKYIFALVVLASAVKLVFF